MAKIEKQEQQVTPSTTTEEAHAAPAFLRESKQEGKGISTKPEDNLVPMIYVLQTNSPQVNKRGAEYIEGAEAGDIWLRNSSTPIVKGDSGMLFQPCYFSKDWVEWIPRDDGGGFVARHPANNKDMPPANLSALKIIADPKDPNSFKWVMPNGHELRETRYHVGFVIISPRIVLPYVIPLSGTGHSVSRAWMGQIGTKMNDSGERYNMWTSIYKLRTKHRTNKKGDWFSFDVEDMGFIRTPEENVRGATLHEAFESGAKVADSEVAIGAEQVDTSGAM